MRKLKKYANNGAYYQDGGTSSVPDTTGPTNPAKVLKHFNDEQDKKWSQIKPKTNFYNIDDWKSAYESKMKKIKPPNYHKPIQKPVYPKSY